MRLIAVASLWSCVAFSQPRKVTTLQGQTMGTTYSIKVSSSIPLPFNLKQKVDLLLVDLNKKLSTYITTSEISKFNQLPAMSKHTASKEMLENFEISKKVHRLSSGAFEPTISNLVDLWGFGKPAAGTPKHSQIKAAMLHIGIAKIRQTADTLIKTDDKIRLDFSGVAKGYAVDKIAEYLRKKMLKNFLVEIGGEVLAEGEKQEDQAWTLGIEAPVYNERSLFKTLKLSGNSMATSGSYRNYREVDGRRLSHIIDPRTGYPIEHRTASVTVIHKDCGTADALATAFMVMGLEKGIKVADTNGIAAYFISRGSKSFTAKASAAFTTYMLKKGQ